MAQGDILEDIELIENLEETKRTATDIAEKVKLAKETEVSISKAREVYRPVATRGANTYFLIDSLNALDRVYHYSMANFVYILRKGKASSEKELIRACLGASCYEYQQTSIIIYDQSGLNTAWLGSSDL